MQRYIVDKIKKKDVGNRFLGPKIYQPMNIVSLKAVPALCKNKGCKNPRRNGSAYCHPCATEYFKKQIHGS